jgi:predicted AAA+ superfamily ATPase
MYPRIINYPKNKSFFLFGPRGTGKTSWVKKQFPGALYLDLLQAELFNDLLARPNLLEKMIPEGHNDWIILDEVQRVPELLFEVHRLIEGKGYKFILTGSSARKLRKKGVNLLGGRAITLHMHPLTAAELGDDFDLEHSLKFGQLPCAYTEAEPQKYLESYVSTYLREEVQQEGLTRNLGAFSRFLEAASFSQASPLNISAVARECAVDRKNVQNYFSILEDMLLSVTTETFTKRAKRRIIAHPKFYFFDAGVYMTLRPMGPLDRPEEATGISLETLLLQELRAMNDYDDLGYTIHYWRTSNNIEVDFVLYGNKGIRAFEVKRTGRIRNEDTRGLKAFLKDYPAAKAYLIYGGDRRLNDGQIEIVPMVDCLKNLRSYLS